MTDEYLVIDHAHAADVESVIFVERHCFGSTWTRAQYLNELASPYSRCLVARIDDQVVAFGILSCADDQAYIPTIGVLETYRRHGIGARLLAAMLAAAVAMGAREVVLEVRFRNVAARRLYESAGFTEIGYRRGYYEDPADDAVVMRWQQESSRA